MTPVLARPKVWFQSAPLTDVRGDVVEDGLLVFADSVSIRSPH